MDDALETQKQVALEMGVKKHHVSVASTGVIGVNLPMDKISSAISNINLDENQSVERFENAILTTDTKTKHTAVKVEIDGKVITIGGAAKGSAG